MHLFTEGRMTKKDYLQMLTERKVIAIMRAKSSEELIEAAEAICAGGISVIEVTMTTPGALNVIEKARAKFKSEVLFECRVNPFDRVSDLAPEAISALVSSAAQGLRRNASETSATAGRRTMTSRLNREEALWVYRRAGRPCHRCGSAIEVRKSGPDGRSTYWCPSCQSRP